ncbi:hypothetical protein [Pengzhenrongella frigida]|uniref:Uncharacterized protein n=1 Tax=Pengzhenrongella frigida TaxID=1259133 RepID=A0A4Q5MVJ4_9MICO|nr:hypothetical protein [Cellulomonas sp. HLT2-17]RYV49550.1 hypothetical protein EUA98_18140 [Cellulomonas sp. HLT2-17]
MLGALTLGDSAYLHSRIAVERPPLFADGQVTLSGLFVAQASAAALVVIWVVVRPSVVAWLAFGAVAAGSLGALVLSVYVQVPSIGPFPVIYEPLWYQDKYLATASAAAAVLVALVALVWLRRLAR